MRTKRSNRIPSPSPSELGSQVTNARRATENAGLQFVIRGKLKFGMIFICRAGYWLGTYDIRKSVGHVGVKARSMTLPQFVEAMLELERNFQSQPRPVPRR